MSPTKFLMPVDDQTCHKMVPPLRDWLSRIVMEIAPLLEIEDWRNRGDFVFMGVCFLSKQLSHSESLLRLVPHKDSVLISRAMVEGLVQFLWASKKPDERANDWRAFAIVEDFNSIPIRKRLGNPPTEEMMIGLTEAISKFGTRFLKKNARKEKAAGRALPPRPYCDSWRRNRRISEVFRDVEGTDLRDFFYGPFSAWSHWSSAAFADRFDNDDPNTTTTRWTPVAGSMAASSLVIAIMCVLQTAGVLFEYMEHPSAGLAATLRDEFQEWQREEMTRLVDED